jgi:hypothetical protein
MRTRRQTWTAGPETRQVKHAPSDLSEQLQDFVIDEVIGMLKRDKIITFTFKMLKLKLKSIASISQKDLVEPMTKIAETLRPVYGRSNKRQGRCFNYEAVMNSSNRPC